MPKIKNMDYWIARHKCWICAEHGHIYKDIKRHEATNKHKKSYIDLVTTGTVYRYHPNMPFILGLFPQNATISQKFDIMIANNYLLK